MSPRPLASSLTATRSRRGRRDVYLSDIQHLADHLGDEVEKLAERVGPLPGEPPEKSASDVIGLVVILLGRRLARHHGLSVAFLRAAMTSAPKAAESAGSTAA